MLKSLPDWFVKQVTDSVTPVEQGVDPSLRDVAYKLLSSPVHLDLSELKFGNSVYIPGQYADSVDTGAAVQRLKYTYYRGKYVKTTPNCDVYILGSAPSAVDANNCRQLTRFDDKGPPELLFNALASGGVARSKCFYSTASKIPNPKKAGAFPEKLITLSKPLTYFEISQLKPKVILCLGTEATKCLFGKKTGLSEARGRVLDFYGIPVITTVSPGSFVHNMGGLDEFFMDVAKVGVIASGGSLKPIGDGINYPSRDYQSTTDVATLEEWVAEELSTNNEWLAIDTETGNDTGRPDNHYIITMQWSPRPRVSRLFVQRGEGGKEIHSLEDQARIASILRRLLTRRRLIGHNLRYDIQRILEEYDINLVPFFGEYFDTMTAYHKLFFAKQKGLDHLTLKYTDMGPYWYFQDQWVEENSGKEGLGLFPKKKKSRYKHGFRDITYKYLIPYACCDTDATYRIFVILKAELDKPGNESIKEGFYKIDMPTNSFLHEIETNGVPADKDKLYELSDLYHKKIEELTKEIRALINWPEMNPASSEHKLAFLFSGSKFLKSDKINAIPPAGALTLKDQPPLFTSGKFPKPWSTVKSQETTGVSTDRNTLKSLVNDPKYKDLTNPLNLALKKIYNVSEISQFAKTFLAKPKIDEPEAKDEEEDDDVDEADDADPTFIYNKGLISCIRENGRVCCRIDPLSETGRMKHKDPNLANLPKSKESGIEAVFGEKIDSVRNGFAAPPGYVFMEADYSAAEVWTMGYLSGEDSLISLLRAGADIHSANARKFFGIGLDLTDEEFKSKFKAKRVAAKATLFSVAYGTGAPGLARRLTLETGKEFPVADAETSIKGFHTTYPKVSAFLNTQKKNAVTQEYVETKFGRRRYFPGLSRLGHEAQSKAMREGPNMVIQGTVADMLNQAGTLLYKFRYSHPLGQEMGFEILLAIHDAIIVLVKEEYKEVMGQIMRYCMHDKLRVPCADPTGKIPVSVECGHRWGDLEELEGFDKKTPIKTWCETHLDKLPPKYRETLTAKQAA